MVKEYGALVFAGGAFLAAVTVYFILATPDRHTHAGYFPVVVLSTFDTSTTNGFRYSAVVRLPDGTQTTVSTQSLPAAQWFLSDTCVEKRLRKSGRALYRLAAPTNCLS